ncbi:MAG: LysR substrate-binding domain-containing protein [Pseudorhizobium sp.]
MEQIVAIVTPFGQQVREIQEACAGRKITVEGREGMTIEIVAIDTDLLCIGSYNWLSADRQHLGVQLLHRTTRRVELTRAGEVFYDRCIRILGDIKSSAELARSADGKGGAGNPDRDDLFRHHWCPILVFVAHRQEVSRHPNRYRQRLHQRHHPQHRGRPAEHSFAEKFEEHDLAGNVSYTCDDTFSLVSLVSAGLGVGFAPEWTRDLPNRHFELKKVRGIEFKIGLGVAWNKEDPTAGRDDIIDIARSLVRPRVRAHASPDPGSRSRSH